MKINSFFRGNNLAKLAFIALSLVVGALPYVVFQCLMAVMSLLEELFYRHSICKSDSGMGYMDVFRGNSCPLFLCHLFLCVFFVGFTPFLLYYILCLIFTLFKTIIVEHFTLFVPLFLCLSVLASFPGDFVFQPFILYNFIKKFR